MTCALIAGRGRLPELLAAALASAREPVIYALAGQEPDLPHPVTPFRLETLGSLFADMTARGVTGVCLAGAVHRPGIDAAAVDAATRPLVPRIAAALAQGDDGALKIVLQLFEEAGFAVVGAERLLPGLLPAPGVPTRRRPAEAHLRDAARGMAVIERMGAADVGQACVVAGGQVLAVEAQPGTDWMLATLHHRPAHLPAGGVLCKAPKPGQDRRVDLPTIGPDTVRNAADAGLEGIAVAHCGVLVLDAADAIAEADRRNLFIWIRDS